MGPVISVLCGTYNKFCLCNFWCLRLSYNMASTDCAGALFYAMMKYAVDTPHDSAGNFSFQWMELYNL